MSTIGGGRMQEVLYRRAQFARAIGVSETTVKNWLAREEREPGTGVRFVRLPTGERRIPASEVERILRVVGSEHGGLLG